MHFSLSFDASSQFDGSRSYSIDQMSHITKSASAASIAETATIRTNVASINESSPNSPPVSPTKSEPSIIQNLVRSTIENQKNIEKEFKTSNPPLNLCTTTPRNLTKFICRIGFAVALQEKIINILTWKNPPATILAMVAYTFICESLLCYYGSDMTGFYPNLLLLAPQFLLIYIIANNYYKKTKRIVIRKSRYTANVQYLKNLQFIQNFMSSFTDTYDTVKEQSSILNWENEEETLSVLKLVVLSIIGKLAFVRIIPLNYVALGGLVVFVQNTGFFRALKIVLLPLIQRKFKRHMNGLKETVQSFQARRSPDDDSTVTIITVFENQRWWAGMFEIYSYTLLMTKASDGFHICSNQSAARGVTRADYCREKIKTISSFLMQTGNG